METKVIEEQLKVLVQLQAIDGQLYQMREELERKPQELESARQVCQQHEVGLKASEEQLKRVTLDHKEKDLQLQTEEEKIKKFQVQLFQVKTNKEYQAMQQEIQGAKADTSVLEEEIIRLLDGLDAAKQEVDRGQRELQAARATLAQEEGRIQTETAAMQAKITVLSQQRHGLVGGVEKALLAMYDRILKSRRGMALVPIHGEACGGCRMTLPPQVVNEVRLKEQIMQCENCQRILYWQE